MPHAPSFAGRWRRLTRCGQGFDEFMNVVLDNAAEVSIKGTAERKELGPFSIRLASVCEHQTDTSAGTPGRILLKGDNITLIQQVN